MRWIFPRSVFTTGAHPRKGPDPQPMVARAIVQVGTDGCQVAGSFWTRVLTPNGRRNERFRFGNL